MITLRNDFHNSEARVRISIGKTLTRRQTRRAYRKLCGMADCYCGAVRGPQRSDDGTPFTVDDDVHGRWVLVPI